MIIYIFPLTVKEHEQANFSYPFVIECEDNIRAFGAIINPIKTFSLQPKQ